VGGSSAPGFVVKSSSGGKKDVHVALCEQHSIIILMGPIDVKKKKIMMSQTLSFLLLVFTQVHKSNQYISVEEIINSPSQIIQISLGW